jgi:hypothetical protein
MFTVFGSAVPNSSTLVECLNNRVQCWVLLPETPSDPDGSALATRAKGLFDADDRSPNSTNVRGASVSMSLRQRKQASSIIQ